MFSRRMARLALAVALALLCTLAVLLLAGCDLSPAQPTAAPGVPTDAPAPSQPTAIPTATGSEPDGTADGLDLDDSDDLSALLADFDEDDSFVGLELDDEED